MAIAVSVRTGLDVTLVRIVLVLITLLSGVGLAVYVVAWLVVPAEQEPESIGSRALSDGRGLALSAALFPGLILSLLIASALDAGWLGSLAWPLFIALAGMVLIWRNGSAQERSLLRRVVTPLTDLGSGTKGPSTTLAFRVVLGLLVAGGAVATLTVGHHSTLRPLGGVALVLAAFVIIFGPWWLRIARDLVAERQSRLQAEQAADLAARVHDSVLQTLALIQRHADDPQRVAQLARAQERELRSWLFEGRPPGSFDGQVATLSGVIRRLQTEVETAHGVQIDAVVVGDCLIGAEVEALPSAGREAMVNAAKWSGATTISLFVEVESATVSLFVRDRGCGFDPSGVTATHQGIEQSIKGRMARSGGSATVRSAPGAGTEVELTIPRRARASSGKSR